MFLLEKISTKSNAFLKICKVIDRTGIKTFNSSWMTYPSWSNITDSELNNCLLLWATPLCSLSVTENAAKHLECTQKIWKLVCSEMDEQKDSTSVARFYHILGLIFECYIAILNSKHMSENTVRNLMDSISRDILLHLSPLINGGFQTLLKTFNASMNDYKFVLIFLNVNFRLRQLWDQFFVSVVL